MLGGNDTWLFLQGLGGFLVLFILIYFLKWAFPSISKTLRTDRSISRNFLGGLSFDASDG